MTASGLSVLTLVKNRSAHLAKLIEGLRRSESAPDELIVVDMDGGWKAPSSSGFPIRVISMPSTALPLATARNAAATAATSEHLLFLDVDCIPARNLIGSMSEHLDRSDAVICADVRYLASGDINGDWREENLLAVAWSHPVKKFPSNGLRRESNAGLFWSLAFALRRSLFLRLGGFDETFNGYGAEDTDFGFRAKDAGVDLYFAAGPGAFHQCHDVFDPPLQHFADIVANATTFHRKWKIWPMEGWLASFEAMGLIQVLESKITVRRAPTAKEIAEARKGARF